MIYNLPNEFNKFAILSISEVAEVLKFKTNESAVSWLIDNQVNIHRFGKKNKGVYELDFYSTLLIPFSKSIIQKYPKSWKDLLKEVIIDDSIYKMILLKIDDNLLSDGSPKTKVKPKTNKEIKLRNELLS